MVEMKTLTIGDTTYEIVDDKARKGSLIITQEVKEEIVAAVIAALPVYNGEVVTE